MSYGILRSSTNTGSNAEILCGFTAPLQIISNQPSYVQDMMNLRRRASSQNIQRWEIETGLVPSNNSSEFLAHSVANGHDKVFFVRMPQVANMKITTVPSQLISAAAVGAVVVNMSTPVSVGEFFQLAGGTKVYMAHAVNGSAVSCVPRLNKAAANGTAVLAGKNVTMRARYDQDIKLGITYVDGILSNPGTVKLIEDL